jgi:hypothetical protein
MVPVCLCYCVWVIDSCGETFIQLERLGTLLHYWGFTILSYLEHSIQYYKKGSLFHYLHTHSLTDSMMHNIIWKADCHSAYQKYPFFIDPEGSLPCSQKPATGPYPEPAESSSPHRSLSP